MPAPHKMTASAARGVQARGIKKDQTLGKRRSNRLRNQICAPRVLRAHDVLARLVRTRVRDDGSCWAYGVLACLGLCDHAKKAPFPYSYRAGPTDRDLRRVAALRTKIYEQNQDEAFAEAVLRLPKYDDEKGLLEFGGYGGPEEFSAIAKILNIDIAMWDENNEEAEACALFEAVPSTACEAAHGAEHNDAEQIVFVSQWPVYPGMMERVPVGDILKRMDKPRDRPLVHLAWSYQIDAHIEAYVETPKPVFKAPDWLRV